MANTLRKKTYVSYIPGSPGVAATPGRPGTPAKEGNLCGYTKQLIGYAAVGGVAISPTPSTITAAGG